MRWVAVIYRVPRVEIEREGDRDNYLLLRCHEYEVGSSDVQGARGGVSRINIVQPVHILHLEKTQNQKNATFALLITYFRYLCP